jgi:hypothetical protein
VPQIKEFKKIVEKKLKSLERNDQNDNLETFGIDLVEISERNNSEVPIFILKSIQYLRTQNAYRKSGLFRNPGNKHEIEHHY